MSKIDSICVLITVYNEEHHMVDCIQNARLLTEKILVVDTESTDSTAQLARKQGVPVKSFPYKKYVEPSRNFAISHVDADWVFILDADERFTPELIKEIKNLLSHDSQAAPSRENFTHYKVPRTNIFAGKWHLRFGGWNNDSIIRLIKMDAFKDWPAAIHSTPNIDGECGVLKNPLEHHFHPNLENMVDKTATYEEMEAKLLFEAGRKASVPIFFRKFAGELYRRLIKNQGYRDGVPGIIESLYQAYSKTVTYLYVYEKSTAV